jgi:hypothetical protein
LKRVRGVSLILIGSGLPPHGGARGAEGGPGRPRFLGSHRKSGPRRESVGPEGPKGSGYLPRGLDGTTERPCHGGVGGPPCGAKWQLGARW